MKNDFYLSNVELYNNGEAVVFNIVLHAVQKQVAKNPGSKAFTSNTKLFVEAGLSMRDIALIISQIRIGLLIPFSYDILLEQHKNATIGDLTHRIWKGMWKALKYN